MANTIGQFGFELSGMGPFTDEGLSIPTPVIHICLAQSGKETRNGFPCLMMSLMDEREIDVHIRLLKDDLDAVGAAAKRALIKAKAKAKIDVAKRVVTNGQT